MGTGSFPGVKRPGRGADHPPPSKVPRPWKGRAIPLLTLWPSVACYRETFTFTIFWTTFNYISLHNEEIHVCNGDSICLFSGRNSVLNVRHMASCDTVSFSKEFFPAEFNDQLFFHFLPFLFICLASGLIRCFIHSHSAYHTSRTKMELTRRLCLCRATFLWFTVSLLREFRA